MKKSLVGFLVIAVLCVLSFSVFAAEYDDVSSNFWGEEAIESLTEEGVINGDGDGNYRPDDTITRAEFVKMIVDLFEPTEMADLSQYKDVNKKAWYYESLSKAVALGAIKGDSETTMRPDASITRQEAVVIINRIIELGHSSSASAKKFVDAKEVASWAMDAILSFTENGFVNGYEDGTLQPDAPITRAESAQIIHNAVGKIITKPGTYDLTGVEGVVIIKCEGVTLKNTKDTDKVMVTSEKAADTLKVEGSKGETIAVAVVGEETKEVAKTEEKKTTSSGGGGGSTVAEITITDDGEKYVASVTNGTPDGNKRLKVIVGNETVVDQTVSENSYMDIVDAVLAKLNDDEKLKKGLDVYTAEALAAEKGKEAFAADTATRGTISVVYQALVDAGMTRDQIIAKLKDVITYDDAVAALKLVK